MALEIDSDIQRAVAQFEKCSLREQQRRVKKFQKTMAEHRQKYADLLKKGEKPRELDRLERQLKVMEAIVEKRGKGKY